MEGDQRPPLGQRNSSQSSGRLNARARNSSAKNLSKLTKITAGHGAAKVTMPRNTSKTNLRKNQSETSLQRHRTQGSVSGNTARDSSYMTKDAAESLQISPSDTTKRRSPGSRPSIPKADSTPSYQAPQIPVDKSKPVQQKPGRSKKRSSRDHTASGGKKSKDQQFDFDREELFDDEAWIDEHVETADNTSATYLPEESEAHGVNEPQDTEGQQEEEKEEKEQSPSAPVAQIITATSRTEADSSDLKSPDRRVSFADEITKLTQQQSSPPQNILNPSIQIHPASNNQSQPIVLPPALTDPQATSLHLERDIQAALDAGQDVDEARKDTTQQEASQNKPTASKVQFAIGPSPSSVRSTHAPVKKSEAIIAASDSDTSRETVVLASKTEPTPSALKSTPVDTDITGESPPTIQKRPPKKRVQIEEPPEEDDFSNSNPSTGPTTPSILTDATTSAPRPPSFTSVPQYDFLSKSQRDRASIMIQHHPYPPSAWRDNFLNRATPYINDVHEDYTQKFVRRLDRRVDNRLKNIMQFQDPLLLGIQRAQATGVIASFGPDDATADMADSSRAAAGGIGGWFSRLGASARRDAPKPASKEQLDAERLDRWERLVALHELELASGSKQAATPERPLTAETTAAAE